MAVTTEESILNIKVNWGEAANVLVQYKQQLEQLQAAEQELKAEQEQLDTTTAEGARRYEEISKELARVNALERERKDEIRTLQKEMQNEVRQADYQQGSLKQLRAELSNLTKQYDMLSEADRKNINIGGELARKINATTEKIKEGEQATQRYYRSVGNYKNSIMDALGANSSWFRGLQTINGVMQGGVKNAFAVGTQAVKAFGMQLMSLLAHPVVAILAVIAAGIMMIVKGIKSSEENSMKLRIVLEPLNRILQYQLKMIQDIASVLLDWAINAGKAIMKLSEWAEKLPIIGKYIKQFNDTIKESIATTEQENQNTKKSRENAIENAKTQAEIAKLRNEAAQKDKYTLEQRKEMLEKAIQLEQDQLDRNRKLARSEYEVAKSRSAQSHNNAEANERLAEAEKKLYDVERDYYQGTMRLQRQRANIMSELASNEAKTLKQRQTNVENHGKAILQEMRKYEDILVQLITDSAERQREKLRINYERQVADIEARMKTEKHLASILAEELVAIKQKYIVDAAKLELQLTQQSIQLEQNRIEILLSAATKETQEEYNLKLAKLEQQKALDLLEIEQAEYTEEQKGELRLAIAQKYANTYDELEKERINAERERQQHSLQVMFETALAKAGDDALEVSRLQMEYAQQQREQLQRMQGETLEDFNLRQAKADAEYLKAKKNYSDKQVEIEQSKFTAMSNITDGLVSLTEELGESDESFAKASKVLALATIAIQTGAAIAKMVGMESGKGIAGLATMASGIATILANIATAIKTVRSAKFAGGGLIHGRGSGTSDSNTIRVSDGESVINARSTQMFAPLLSQLNQIGGGVPIEITSGNTNTFGEDMLAAAFARGAMMIPSPHVVVEEINAVGRRVEVLEQLGKV